MQQCNRDYGTVQQRWCRRRISDDGTVEHDGATVEHLIIEQWNSETVMMEK